MKIAAAYLRRSSATTESPGDASREAQESAVRRLCGDAVALYVDWGISGRKSDRPEYQRLRKDIAEGRIASVCAYSLSRLGRNARELLDFIELAQRFNVPVRTAVESIDTSSAMGRAMLTVMAAFAQLEVEQGMERSAAARAVRKARYDDAEVPMPGSLPPYGHAFVTDENRITRVVPDGTDKLDTVLAIYREAGTIQGACALLQARGIAAPKGGPRWSTSALTRVIEREWPELMPRAVKSGIRVPTGRTSTLTKLVRCPFCDRFMTPNTARRQLYCSHGPTERETHPRYVASEPAIMEFVKAEAALLVPPADRLEGESAVSRLAAIAEDRRRLDKRYALHSIDDREFEAGMKALDEQESEIVLEPGHVEIAATIDVDEDPVLVNEALRSIWRYIELDETMQPRRAEWVREDWRAA